MGILDKMPNVPTLRVVVLDDTLDDHIHDVVPQTDVVNAVSHRGNWIPSPKMQLPGVYMHLSVTSDSALVVVGRMSYLLAHAVIVGRSQNALKSTCLDLLEYDPDDEWFAAVQRRNDFAAILDALEPPFCLIGWKSCSSGCLSQRERRTLRAELLRVVLGVANEALGCVRIEK